MRKENDNTLVSYLIISYNRCDELEEVINSLLRQNYQPFEIIIVDNNSTDNTAVLFETSFVQDNIKFYQMSENLGVSGGRNIAFDKSSGEILITIDDDAVIEDPDSTQNIVDKFACNEDVGILAFKIVNYYTNEIQSMYFPCRDKSRNPDIGFETTWFIGAGHAMQREVFKKVGYYRDYWPWGSEEFDFSLRAVNAGYRIEYFPDVTVRHKVAQSGRVRSKTRFKALALRHRLKAAALNLPWYSFFTMIVVRSVQILVVTKGNVIALLLAYGWILMNLPAMLRERDPISSEAVKKLRVLKGPLYF